MGVPARSVSTTGSAPVLAAGASSFYDAALELNALEILIFPCEPRGKAPLTEHGFKDATLDLGMIVEWARQWPDANPAMPTGRAFDALDIDGDEGFDTLAELAGGEHAIVPCGPVVRTPRGAHLYYEPTGLGNKVGFLPGLDWRGAGGYALGVGSVGTDGTPYTWYEEAGEAFDLDRPLVQVPGWLHRVVEPPGDAQNRRVADEKEHPGARVPGFWDKFTAPKSKKYVMAALEAEGRAVSGAVVGTRNDQLNRSTHTLARLDNLDASTIESVMLAAALAAGLDEREASRTIRSALEARGVS
jgi:Bifunctional DNA primase/polymerase, N-terminal